MNSSSSLPHFGFEAKKQNPARILSIAGSDSSGGAGIQADLKTIAAFGGFGMTVITALTAQNTKGVQAIHPVPAAFVQQQIESVVSDIGVDAIKIGMLANKEIIQAVEQCLKPLSVPIILDPVLVATSGDVLLEDSALEALKELMCLATIITPNIPEATVLSGQQISSFVNMWAAADHIIDECPVGSSLAVLIKGGHLSTDILTDLLVYKSKTYTYDAQKQNTRNTHGTGCTLSAAIACLKGQGLQLPEAVRTAHGYVQEAIANAPNFGDGNGPLWH